MVRVLAGTSGYSYSEWKGPFYPADLPGARMLAFYAERFGAVEINNTFYKMPTEKLVSGWAAEVPPHFRFAVKAPGRITHQKRLKNVSDDVTHLWKIVDALGERLGPVLFGLPPNMKKDLPRLEDLLARLPAGRRAAVEFRHETWFDDAVYAALRARDVALCIADAEELSTPFVPTAGWGYLRLRRPGYDDAALDDWAARTAGASWSDAYCFFKHEDEGVAPRLAAAFMSRFGAPARPAS